MSREADVEEAVEAIRSDKVHGASWLSNAALDTLKSVAEKRTAKDAKELLDLLRDVAKRLMDARPIMTPLTNMVARLLYEIEANSSASLCRFRRLVAEKADTLAEESKLNRRKAAENVARLVEGTAAVITCSYSSTVFEALNLRPEARVIIAESRPLYEGRELAEHLAERNIETTLIVDAAMAYFAGEADAALVGADSVLADGSVVNKVGTRLLALAAGDVGIPFYVACETSKFDVRNHLGRPPVLEEKDPVEVAEGLSGVEVRNPYFEVTPARLISAVVTEKGVMDLDAIMAQMEEMSRYVRPLLR